MKSKFRLSIVLLCISILFAHAEDDKYVTTMKKQILAVYQAETIESLAEIVNTFDRISGAEKEKWEPLYYSAFGRVMMATRETDNKKKDVYLELALKNVKAAKQVTTADVSEVMALEGFVYMMMVTVDPASRGQLYSGKAFAAYQKALQINPNNPRALSLLAQMQLGTARFFNASTDEACQTGQAAVAKFKEEKDEIGLKPIWGKGMAEKFLSQCK
jgi:hypothetical protein